MKRLFATLLISMSMLSGVSADVIEPSDAWFQNQPDYIKTQPIYLHIVDGVTTHFYCNKFKVSPSLVMDGCAIWQANHSRCDIYIREDIKLGYTTTNYNDLLKHELAHCYGWPGNHTMAAPYFPVSRW